MLLSACTTLGPDYKEPEVAWLKAWQSDLYGQLESPEQQTQVDLRFWWHAFNDPVLNALIETARRENPSLRIAGLRILESRAVLGIASANQYPQLQQLNGAATYVDNSKAAAPAPTSTRTTAPSAPASTSPGSWISGAASGAASNRPKPASSLPSPTSRTCRCC